MSLTIHQTGIDAAINAQANGFSGETLTHVDLYDGATKIKRLKLEGVAVIEPGRIYVVGRDQTPGLSYNVTKMDFITSGGALFATAEYDDGSIIQSKGPDSILMLSEQLNISAAPGSIAPSGDVSIYMPPATESLLGGAEIATQGEVDEGTDHTRIVTPKTLLEWLKSKLSSSVTSGSTTTPANSKAVKTAYDDGTRSASETQKGQVERATQAEVNAGADDSRYVSPKKLLAWMGSKFKSAAFLDAGQNDGQVALIGDPVVTGNTAVIVARGSNANGKYIIFSDGFKIQRTSKAQTAELYNWNADVVWPIPFDTSHITITNSVGIAASDLDSFSEWRSQRSIVNAGYPTKTGCHMQVINLDDHRHLRQVSTIAMGY